MVRAISTFMEFCYLVRQHIVDKDTLDEIDRVVAQFHVERKIFRDTGV